MEYRNSRFSLKYPDDWRKSFSWTSKIIGADLILASPRSDAQIFVFGDICCSPNRGYRRKHYTPSFGSYRYRDILLHLGGEENCMSVFYIMRAGHNAVLSSCYHDQTEYCVRGFFDNETSAEQVEDVLRSWEFLS